MRGRFEAAIREAQDSICAAIEEVDGTKFRQDAWTRDGFGGGITRVMQGGNVWEKAGVNVSVVYGTMAPDAYYTAIGKQPEGPIPEDAGRVPFFAAGEAGFTEGAVELELDTDPITPCPITPQHSLEGPIEPGRNPVSARQTACLLITLRKRIAGNVMPQRRS